MVKHFGKQGENTARKVLEPMANLYSDLVSKGVLFPPENKFLDYDVDQQATKPTEPKGIRQQPVEAPAKQETEAEFIKRYDRDIAQVLDNRRIASEAILYKNWAEVDSAMKDYSANIELGRKLMPTLEATPKYAETADEVRLELELFEHIDKAHKKFQKDGLRGSFMRDVLAGYKNLMNEDLADQIELSEDEPQAPPIDNRGANTIKPSESGPAIPIMRPIDSPKDISTSPIPLPSNPAGNKYSKPNKRDGNVRFGGSGIGVIDEVDSFEEKRFDSKPTPGQIPRGAAYEDPDSFQGYQDVGVANYSGKPTYQQSSQLRNSSSNQKYQEDERTSRLEQDLRDRIAKQNKERLEEEYQQSLIDRANRERADRERRNRQDDERMNQRQREIDTLLQSTKATSNLVSNSTQIENVALFAQLQKAVFELTSLSKRASTLASEIKAANQDFGKQELRVDRGFSSKGKEADRLQELQDKKSRLQEQKELMVRKVENRKEEIQRLRVETGNAGTAKMDDEVQKDLDRIDRLMEAKGQELKREKQRYERLRNQYEEHQNQVYERKQKALTDETLNQTRPGTPPKRHGGTAFDLGGSNYVQSSLLRSGIENSGVKGSNYSKASRAMPKIQSELKPTPGSAFLDDFNRDLQRLLFKEDTLS